MKSIHDFDLHQLSSQKSYFPSPVEWEDQVLYFLLADRFSNARETDENLFHATSDYENTLKDEQYKKIWDQNGRKWNGGTLKGIQSKIGYLKGMGVTAIWISPTFKQVEFEETYHGYGIQNFLDIDPHFGTKEDMLDLVKEAHENGIYIIIDIIFNHTANIFEYEAQDPVFNGSEFPVKGFRNSKGEPVIPFENFKGDPLGENDGIIPRELMNPSNFNRKGQIVNWDNNPEYVHGDFFSFKDVNTGSGDVANYTPSEALKVLTECFKYWIAFADIDGFRLDTVKHIDPGATRYFAHEIHEFALSIGKNNFYIFGEITGGFNFAIDTMNKTGLDAALGINQIPEKLEQAAKGYQDASEFFNLFKNSELLGEEEHKWYRDNVVSMFDDHDMVSQQGVKSRFCADKTTDKLLLNALFLNVMSPGIPCIYYGTEQGFDGTGDSDEYIRETMFAGSYGAFRSINKHFFDQKHPVYVALKAMLEIRKKNITLKQGRLYQRQISNDGINFDLSHKKENERYSGIIAWSRILSQDEIVLLINSDLENNLGVDVVVDNDLHLPGDLFNCIYSSNSGQVSNKTEVTMKENFKTIRVEVPAHGRVAFKKIQ